MPFPYLIAAGAQAVISVFGGRAQASALRRAAANARIQGQIAFEQATFQARQARRAGAEYSTQIRRTSRRVEGAAVRTIASAGLEVSGSPLMDVADQIWQDERAAGTAVVNAEAGAVAIESQGRAAQATAEAESRRLRTEAGFSELSGWLGAANAALTAVANFTLATGRAPGLSDIFGGE